MMSSFNKRKEDPVKPANSTIKISPDLVVKGQQPKINYLDILLKYKQMAGSKKISVDRASAQKKTPKKEVAAREQINESPPQKIKFQRKVTLQRVQQAHQPSLVTNVVAGKTHIKFLIQKQHVLSEIDRSSGDYQLNLPELRQKIDQLKGAKKSSSVPSLSKELSPSKSRTVGKLLATKSKLNEPQARSPTAHERLQRERSLNSVAFLLSNLKQKVAPQTATHHKSMYKSNLKNSNSFYSQNSPTKMGKSRIGLMQLSSTSPVEVRREVLKENFNQSPQKQANLDQNPQQQEKQKVNSQTVASQPNPKTIKQKIVNERLEQIKQDIENQNNEKEEILKQHRNANKHLQISVLQKQKRISQLQAELSKYEASQHNGDAIEGKEEEAHIAQLQEEKVKKERQYRQQKDSLKQQIAKMEKKIVEQQNKYNTLRQSQLQVKDQQIHQKQKQMQEKSKQMAEQLQIQRKKLEYVIKQQQEKSKLYKLQLEEQARRNEMISDELKKQQQLEQLLLMQVENIARERKEKQEKQEEHRNKEKMRLIEEIQKLEQAETRILMEYQRDSQAASNIFQSMRLKNLELEQKLRKAKKQKQGVVQQQNSTPTVEI